MSQEVWKPVPSCPGWHASSLGRLAKDSSYPMPRGGLKRSIVEPTYGQLDTGKNRFKQSVNGKTRWVASLVCEAFNGPRPDPKMECMHRDEDSTNNSAANLAWGTKSENQRSEKLTSARRIRLAGNRHAAKSSLLRNRAGAEGV